MGGSRPGTPTVVMPAPTSPTLYQSTVPLQSYQDLAEQLQRIQAETGKIQAQRYQEVGTPAEIGARQAGIRSQEAASYLASLPQSSQFDVARDTSKQRLSAAQEEYGRALSRIGETPTPTISDTPSWARRTVVDGNKEITAADLEPKKAEEGKGGLYWQQQP